MREYLDLDKQISHLIIDKSVIFKTSGIDVVEKTLRDNNYRNLISCSKIKFVELIDDYMIMYKSAKFQDWKAYFEMDCRVSKHLMGNLIDFERTINSRVSHYVTLLIERNNLTEYEENELIQIIQSSQRRRLGLKNNQKLKNAYSGEKTWEFVVKMTFGEMKQLLFWLYDNRYHIYLEIVKEYAFLQKKRFAKQRIDEINRLRNNLFHFRPLNIYIVHGNQKRNRHGVLNNKFRKNIVKFILGLNRNRKIQLEVREIFENSDKYTEIKNSQHYVS